MKKKFLATLLTMCMATAVMTGCGEQPVMESSGIEAERPSEETVEESSAEETATTEVIIVPTKFEVYTDGEPHYLMYHADLEHTYWDTFTSISRPDLGIESVSFLSEIVDYEGEMRRCDSNNYIDLDGDMTTPIDLTSTSFVEDDGYGVEIPAVGICGIISREFDIAEEVPTLEEVKEFVKGYGIGSWNELFCETSEDGELMYASFCRIGLDESKGLYFYGGYAFRIHDGKAQGAYVAIAGDDLDDGMGVFRYMMQSLRFAD